MSQPRRRELSDTSFIKRLTEYRDIILLVLVFLGGGTWIITTFATQCLLHASLEAQKTHMAQQARINELSDKRLELQILENAMKYVNDL